MRPGPLVCRTEGRQITTLVSLLRRVGRVLVQTAVILLLAALLAEGLLQVAALFGHDRERADAVAANAREILCVGDSHTYGALVPPDESYPAHLQRLLDARAPGTYAVVNLGVPGYNTALTRERLHGALARHHPDVVIVWCGVNNAWNRSGPDDVRASWRARLDAWASQHVRLLRLARTWLHDRELDAELAQLGGRAPEVIAQRNPDGTVASVTVAGETQQTRYIHGAAPSDRDLAEGLAADYRVMVDEARRAGARVVLVAYPFGVGAFDAANRAMRRVALASGVPLIEASAGFMRVPPEHRHLLAGGHPNGVIYGEIARDIAAAVLTPPDPRRVAPGVLAFLDFTSPPITGDQAPSAAPEVAGPCAYSTAACNGDRGCYRWRPEGGRCSVESRLAMLASTLDVRARIRLGTVESDSPFQGQHFQILGVLEDRFGTGVFVDVIEGNRLKLTTVGRQEGSCGPLERRLERGAWYDVRLHAEKAEAGTVAVEIADAGGAVLDRVRCAPVNLGGGYFNNVRVGSKAPATIAAVDFAEVEVRSTPEPG